MGVINIIAKFVGTDVQTGLERLDAQAQKFSANLGKNLSGGSLSSLLANLAAGFGALQVKDSVVNTFKTLAEDAERAADASERMRDAVNSSINANNNAEGKLINARGDSSGDKAQLKLVEAEMARMEKEAEYTGEIRARPEVQGNPVISAVENFLNWVNIARGSATGEKGNYEKLLADKRSLEERIQKNSGSISAQERGINTADRLTGYDAAQSRDERLVMNGRISSSDAQRRLIGDLKAEYDAKLNDPTQSTAQRAAARIAIQRAENGLIPIQAREDFNRLQGITGQISASSLARIGGGGNVNVLGGREGTLETEARLHTQYLRTIAENSAKAGNQGDVE